MESHVATVHASNPNQGGEIAKIEITVVVKGGQPAENGADAPLDGGAEGTWTFHRPGRVKLPTDVIWVDPHRPAA